MTKATTKHNDFTANIGFLEVKLWLAADKLRHNMYNAFPHCYSMNSSLKTLEFYNLNASIAVDINFNALKMEQKQINKEAGWRTALKI